MKIALLLRRYITTGGAERYAMEVARRLAKKHEVHIFAQEWDHKPSGMTIHRVSRPFKKPSFLNQWWFSWRTSRMARGFDVVYTHERVTRFDVMHIHCGTFVGGLMDPTRSTKNRSRSQLWLKILTGPSIWAYWLLEKIHYRFQPSRHWIAVSEMTKSEVQRYYDLPDTSFTIAHSGVDQPTGNIAERRLAWRRQLGLREDEVALLFVGSEFRRKGLDALLVALGALKQPTLRLLVVGGGDQTSYRQQAAALGISEQIIWVGLAKNTSDYYVASDIYVLPTLSDQSPLSPLEAMAHSCAVVMSSGHFNGGAEVIKNDEAIILKNPKDSTEIASAIQILLNPEIRSEYARKGRRIAQELSWDRTAKIICETLEAVARGKSTGK